MNRKGQSIFMSIIFGIMIFIVGVLFINFIDLDLDSLLGTENLDCDNSDISDGTKMTCLIGEMTIPYFIILFVSSAGGLIAGRFLT